MPLQGVLNVLYFLPRPVYHGLIPESRGPVGPRRNVRLTEELANLA